MERDPIELAQMNSESMDSVGLLWHDCGIHAVTMIKCPSDHVILQLVPKSNTNEMYNVSWMVIDYLFAVRDSGRLNMFMADKALVYKFGINRHQAKTIVRIWMKYCVELERCWKLKYLSRIGLPDVVCYEIGDYVGRK
jgi:hypothetical protein